MRAKNSFTSGICLIALLQRLLHLDRLGQAGAGNAHRRERDVAFVEARDELAAHARRGNAAGDDDRDRDQTTTEPRVPDRAVEQRQVHPLGAAHEEVLLLRDLAGDEERDRGRHEGHREQRCAAPSAISTVSAIGVNILPSTPVSVRIGR